MTTATQSHFGQEQHELFLHQGYLQLGKLLSATELAALQKRLDDIMLGEVRYENMRFQLDPSILI